MGLRCLDRILFIVVRIRCCYSHCSSEKMHLRVKILDTCQHALCIGLWSYCWRCYDSHSPWGLFFSINKPTLCFPYIHMCNWIFHYHWKDLWILWNYSLTLGRWKKSWPSHYSWDITNTWQSCWKQFKKSDSSSNSVRNKYFTPWKFRTKQTKWRGGGRRQKKLSSKIKGKRKRGIP